MIFGPDPGQACGIPLTGLWQRAGVGSAMDLWGSTQMFTPLA